MLRYYTILKIKDKKKCVTNHNLYKYLQVKTILLGTSLIKRSLFESITKLTVFYSADWCGLTDSLTLTHVQRFK